MWRVLPALVALLVVSAPSAAAPPPPLQAALAFSRPAAMGGGVYVLERSGRVRLIARAGVAPAWTPDGRRLAFVAAAEDGTSELYAVDADGRNLGRITRTPGVHEAAPDWSPEGRSLVAEQDGSVVVVRADGADERALGPGSEPAWSPDGRSIVFVSDRSGVSELYLVQPSGRGLRRLPTPTLSAAAPAWSLDGRRLAFVGADSSSTDIYVVSVQNGTLTRVTNDAEAEKTPTWSPDGTTITFVANRTGTDALWSVPATGGEPVPLGGPSLLERPRWRPPTSRELRPDLTQRAPADLSIEAVRRGGNRHFLLGFASATDNVGEGPLSLLSFRLNRAVPTMLAAQRVRLAGGGVRTYPRVGTLRYTVSPSHNHWHLMGFQRYELRRATDHTLVVRDRKSGFCLTDRWARAARDFPGRRPRPVFTDYCERDNADALFVSQGTSIGYSDHYPSHFHGQNLDVTRVPPGTYVLVHRASPKLLIRELRYENNAASLRIGLTWPRGRGKQPAVRILARCDDSDRCPG